MFTKIIYSCIIGLLLTKAGCLASNNKISNEMKLIIYHYKIPCNGENIQWCYLLKTAQGKLQNYYGAIEGLEYQWGFNYTIIVERIEVKNPAQDAASFTYILKKLIKKERVLPGETFELPVKIGDRSLIEMKNGISYYFGALKIETGRFSYADLMKARSAVFSHPGGDKTGLVLVKIK